MKLTLEKITDSQGEISYSIWLQKEKGIFRDCMCVTSSEEDALIKFDEIASKLQEPSTEVIKQLEI